MSLPYDKELYYIESTGTQYIDTGFKPNQDTRIVTVMQCVTSTSYGRLFGSGTYNTLNSVMIDYEVGITGTLYVKYGNKTGWTTTTIHGDYETHTYDFNKNNFYLDGELASSNTYGAFQSTSNLGIFTYINGNNVGSSTEFFIGRLYGFQIYDNDVLVRDFIPVRVGQEGCLYDKVSGNIYRNAGSGSFVLGGDRIFHNPLISNVRRRLLYAKPKREYNYLCLTALESGTFTLTIPASISSNNHVSYVEYSIDDGKNWIHTDNVSNTQIVITTPTIQENGKVLWRGIASRYANAGNNTNNCSNFTSTGSFAVSGNIMSLLYKKDFEDKVLFPKTNYSDNSSWYIFCCLFYNCTGLTDASKLLLPANELAIGSYCSMFEGCTNLIDASFDLPAEFVRGVYEYNGAYRNMFYGCTSLLYPPSINATSCSDNALQSMFYNCSSMITPPPMHFTSVARNCMNNMFHGCSSITSVQSIGNIETASNGCFASMFYGCSSLVSVSKNLLPATTLEQSCYNSMFYGCISLVDAPNLPSTTLVSSCYQYMFYGCSSLETAPELPALTLESSCYNSMFRGCHSLNYIKMMATDIGDNGNTMYFWVGDVASNGTFVRNPQATWWVTGSSGIPNGWLLEDGTEQSDEVIVFEDPEAKSVITSRYGGVIPDTTYSSHWPVRIKGKVDGEITYRQAAHIASITQAFQNNTELIKFHEFQYFTYIDGSGASWFQNCKTLQEITLPNKENLKLAGNAFMQCRDITVLNNWNKVTYFNGNVFYGVLDPFMTLVAGLDFSKIINFGGSDLRGNTAVTQLYLPSLRNVTNFYELVNCILLDIGHDSIITFGTNLFWGWALKLPHEANLVFRCPMYYRNNWSGMDMHQNATGCVFNLYVYEKYYNDYVNDAYWSTADNIYKIGGAEWVAQFGSSSEWADYPNGQAPNVDLTESEVEYVRPLVNTNFDTGIVPTSNTHVVVRCRYLNKNNGTAIGEWQSNSLRFYIMTRNGNNLYFGCGTTEKTYAIDDNVHTLELYGNGTYVVDGTEYSTGTTLGTVTSPIAIFSSRQTGTSYGYQTQNCELYSAKIYEGTTLVKDYVPYRYRGNIYLKEKVSNKLEWVGYGENFEIGNDVNS